VVRKAIVDISVVTDARTTLKIYWAGEGELYSEKNMNRVSLYPGQEKYSFRIHDLSKVKTLRVDTSDEKKARVRIQGIRFSQQGFPPLSLQTKSELEQLKAVEGIEEIISDENGLTVVPAGIDPQLQLTLPPLPYSSVFLPELIRIICIFLLVACLVSATASLRADYGYVPYLAVVVLALIIVMAGISKNNRHPDEYVHVAAAEYYQDHMAPPRIGDPAVKNTYSVYGVSRLHSGEIVYLFAGKFMKLLEPFHLGSYLSLRIFNILLFSILLCLALKNTQFRIFMLPLMISPQIWYVFSYFDSDAFALFVTLLSGYQLAVPSSMFHEFVARGWNRKTWLYFLAVGILFGLLLLLKKNFYFFYVFLFLYFVWKVVFTKFSLQKENIVRIGAIALLGVALLGTFRLADYAVNDFEKEEKLVEVRENYALKMYKPSTPLPLKHPFLQMKERGTTLKYLLLIDRWAEKSFWTSFGVYGYTSVTASSTYYDIVRVTGLLLLAVIVLSVLLKGGLSGNALLCITLGTSAGFIAVALYHAWTVDFQAQGRYFLPIVAMLSVLMFHVRHSVPRMLFHPLLLSMYLLSFYNFVFVGLYGIGKCVP
jgi:hypothetical protein